MQKTYHPQTGKFLAVLAQSMPEISADVMQGWIENQKGLKIVLARALCPEPTSGRVVKQAENHILRLLSAGETITIGKCDGAQTLAQAKDVFKSGIDSDFKNWELDNPGKGKSTEETAVAVHEMAQDANFAKMFGSLGSDLNKLCLTQHQIKTFCENHSKWLRTDGYATFFLFKEDEHFFVANAYAYSGGLRVYVLRFESGRVWLAARRHRLVSSQLGA